MNGLAGDQPSRSRVAHPELQAERNIPTSRRSRGEVKTACEPTTGHSKDRRKVRRRTYTVSCYRGSCEVAGKVGRHVGWRKQHEDKPVECANSMARQVTCIYRTSTSMPVLGASSPLGTLRHERRGACALLATHCWEGRKEGTIELPWRSKCACLRLPTVLSSFASCFFLAPLAY